jgi:hypothetical protein
MSTWTFFWGCAAIMIGLYYLIFKRKSIMEASYEKKFVFFAALIFVLVTFIGSLIFWLLTGW